jgi:hypothetical protein
MKTATHTLANTYNELPCGCELLTLTKHGMKGVRYCYMHAAAPRMLEALKAMKSAKDAETTYGFTDSQVAHMFTVAFDLQVAAIAEATHE